MASGDQYPISFERARVRESNEWKGNKVRPNMTSMTSQLHRDNITEYGERIPDGM